MTDENQRSNYFGSALSAFCSRLPFLSSQNTRKPERPRMTLNLEALEALVKIQQCGREIMRSLQLRGEIPSVELQILQSLIHEYCKEVGISEEPYCNETKEDHSPEV